MLKKLIIRFLIMRAFFLTAILTSQDIVSAADHSSSWTESAREIVRLVELCFTNTNRLVTLIGNVSQKLTEKIHDLEFTAVTRMSQDTPSFDRLYAITKNSWPMYHRDLYFRFDHKAQGFILTATSQPVLRQQINNLKNSRWWNAGGFFMIMADDGTAATNNCKNAQNFLWLTWQYNILSSVFLCHDEKKILTMYTYNPYNGMAPKNWLKADKFHGRYGHPWFLFKRNASESPEKCGEVFFDKTKTLDNYTIRSSAVPLWPRLTVNEEKTGLEKYGGIEGKMMQCIFKSLNASVEDIPYTGKDVIGYIDKNGTFFGILSDLFSGRVDIGLNGRYMVGLWKVEMSYPHKTAEICFLVNSKGNLPQWLNLALVFEVRMSLGLILVILLTTIVLSRYSGVSAGCLNGLRLLISASLLKLPPKLSARFYLASVLSLCLIANGLFQGRFISLLTKPRAYHNPETQAELGKAGYEVVGYPPFAEYIDDPILRSHFSLTRRPICDEKTISAEFVACIFDCLSVSSYFKNLSKLHIVEQRLQTFHMIYITSMDWPLLNRFDQIIQRLVQAGLPDHWEAQDVEIATKGDYGFRSPFLSLADLTFIFDWLIFGLLISTLVFLYEVFSAWYRFRFRKIRPGRQ